LSTFWFVICYPTDTNHATPTLDVYSCERTSVVLHICYTLAGTRKQGVEQEQRSALIHVVACHHAPPSMGARTPKQEKRYIGV